MRRLEELPPVVVACAALAATVALLPRCVLGGFAGTTLHVPHGSECAATTLKVRAMWPTMISAAVTALLSATAPTAAQSAAPEARVTVATQTLSQSPQTLVQLQGVAAMLVATETRAWRVDPATLAVSALFDIDSVWSVDGPAGERRKAVLLRVPGDDRNLIDPVTGHAVANLATNESILVADLQRARIIATFASDSNKIIVRRIGVAAPLYETTLSPDERALPRASLSSDGTVVAGTWHAGVLIDLMTGVAHPLPRQAGDPPIEDVAFLPNTNRLLRLPVRGPAMVIDAKSLAIVQRLTLPEINKRYALEPDAEGKLMTIEGRRQRRVFDPKTGNSVLAERMSSGHRYRLEIIGAGRIIRASVPRMGKHSAYGIYEHSNGDFKQLFRKQLDGLVIDALQPSPNAACLFVVSDASTLFVDTRDNRTLATVSTAERLTHAAFTTDGAAVIAVSEAGVLHRISAPTACNSASVVRR